MCSWQLAEGLQEVPVWQVPLRGAQDGLTPALPCRAQGAHEPRAARRAGRALEPVGKGTARLAPVPEPAGWQGVCH